APGLVVRADGGLAFGAHHTGGPLNGTEQVAAEVVLTVTLGRAAHSGVEGPAAVVIPAPRNRMERAIGSLPGVVIPLLDLRNGVHLTDRVGFPVVPLVRTGPVQRQALVRHVLTVDDVDGRLLNGDLHLGRVGGLFGE